MNITGKISNIEKELSLDGFIGPSSDKFMKFFFFLLFVFDVMALNFLELSSCLH